MASQPKPVAFVRGETVQQQDVALGSKPADAQSGASDDDGIDPRFRFHGTAPGSQQPALLELGPKLPARNKLSFGQMAANYGKGFAMLKKMGFQGGGLGAREDGIANPIEVLKRKERQGLQDEGEMVDQDLYGQEAVGGRLSIEELLTPKASKKHEGQAQASEGWKRDAKAKKPRVVYKSASELASEPNWVRVVDMRGPEVRVATSLSDLTAGVSGDSLKSLKELRHNTSLLISKYQRKTRALAETTRYYEDLLLAAAKERERLEAADSLGQQDASRCRQVVKEIEGLRERQDHGLIGFAELGMAFGRLHAQWPKEFKAMRALHVALALAVPCARQELASWQPLEEAERGLSSLSSWREFVAGEDLPAFTRLCDAVLLPPLRSALCRWSARDVEPCLRLFECCQRVLPGSTFDTLAVQVLLPRLRVEVEAWDPRVDKDSIHMWIHPWLPVLGARLECLWAPIRFKLSKCLERWDPRDGSAREVLGPWRLVLDAANWEPLVENVLARLEKSISGMPVQPEGQDVTPLEDLLAWIGVLPAAGLARVLEVALFPQWRAALGKWLQVRGCDFGEVLQWYQGWKALLPEELREQGAVQRQFAHGLAVMRHFMARAGDAGDAEAAEPPPLPASRLPSRTPVIGTTPSQASGVADEVSMSLCDYLAEVAGEQGLLFRPKNVLHLGKQVYQLGTVSVLLDRNMVYASPKGGQDRDWQLVSLDEVMSLARSETGEAWRSRPKVKPDDGQE